MRTKRALSLFGAVLLVSAAPAVPAQKKKAAPQSARRNPPSPAGAVAPAIRSKSRTGAKKSASRRGRKHAAKRGQRAPTRERIQEIQAALAREGVYDGEPNGKWDTKSIEAMKHFQEAKGLKPTGRFDALSLQKLGLGSEIAGLAAPRPPVQRAPSSFTRPLESAAPPPSRP